LSAIALMCDFLQVNGFQMFSDQLFLNVGKTLFGVAALLSLHLGWAQTSGPKAFESVGHGIVVSHLNNGLTVVVKPLPRAPTAVHMLWVRVGSMDEVDGYTGLAHMLEHMMFKGTPSVPVGEFSRRVAALGGRENAFTDRDFTGYFQQIPSSRLNEVMKLEADRFAHNLWPDEEFKKELEVVKEERRMRTDDSPRSALYEQLESAQFLASPYRRPIIGWMNDLDNMQPQNARDFYQTWYAPNNAVLVVVGDVNPTEVLAQAQTLYGDLPAKALPVRKPRLEPEQKGIRRVSLKAPAKQAYLALSWKVPGFQGFASQNTLSPEQARDSQEALSLTVLSALLDGYEGARLDRALTQGRQRVAQEVGSYYDFSGRGPQVFVLEGVPKEGVSLETLEMQLKAQLQKIAREGVSEQELKRVKAQWVAGAVYKRDSLFNQAQEIGAFWARGLPLDTSDLLIEPLLKVTAEQVQEVAKKYFSDDQLTVAYLWPQALDEQTLKRQQKAQTSGELR
jgi:zinc protease